MDPKAEFVVVKRSADVQPNFQPPIQRAPRRPRRVRTSSQYQIEMTRNGETWEAVTEPFTLTRGHSLRDQVELLRKSDAIFAEVPVRVRKVGDVLKEYPPVPKAADAPAPQPDFWLGKYAKAVGMQPPENASPAWLAGYND